MTRSVIEERPQNFREIDMFSRLIMDRIIFLGQAVDDHIANVINTQLLFLESADIEIMAREVVKLRQELYGIYAERTGKTYQQIHADSDRDYWMRADEAKDYGLIDEVLTREPT